MADALDAETLKGLAETLSIPELDRQARINLLRSAEINAAQARAANRLRAALARSTMSPVGGTA